MKVLAIDPGVNASALAFVDWRSANNFTWQVATVKARLEVKEEDATTKKLLIQEFKLRGRPKLKEGEKLSAKLSAFKKTFWTLMPPQEVTVVVEVPPFYVRSNQKNTSSAFKVVAAAYFWIGFFKGLRYRVETMIADNRKDRAPRKTQAVRYLETFGLGMEGLNMNEVDALALALWWANRNKK